MRMVESLLRGRLDSRGPFVILKRACSKDGHLQFESNTVPLVQCCCHGQQDVRPEKSVVIQYCHCGRHVFINESVRRKMSQKTAHWEQSDKNGKSMNELTVHHAYSSYMRCNQLHALFTSFVESFFYHFWLNKHRIHREPESGSSIWSKWLFMG